MMYCMTIHEGRLTDETFWDEYWSSVSLPVTLDLADPATRSLAGEIQRRLLTNLGSPQGKSLVEIGCAPGRWLEFFHRLGFSVAGIESAPRAGEITRRNLEVLGIDAVIYEADALQLPEKQSDLGQSFDCVLSLGLVEHFEDPSAIIEVHRWLAKPGGLILIGVPNYRGLSGFFQKLLDTKWLNYHNTSVMSPRALFVLGKKGGLVPVDFTYTGGFDPNLYNWKRRSIVGYLLTRTGKLLRKIPTADALQSRHFSSYLLVSFRSPEH
ncbi:MAG: hypothetical protein C4318_01855 [Acidimicrobiia bacterium]